MFWNIPEYFGQKFANRFQHFETKKIIFVENYSHISGQLFRYVLKHTPSPPWNVDRQTPVKAVPSPFLRNAGGYYHNYNYEQKDTRFKLTKPLLYFCPVFTPETPKVFPMFVAISLWNKILNVFMPCSYRPREVWYRWNMGTQGSGCTESPGQRQRTSRRYRIVGFKCRQELLFSPRKFRWHFILLKSSHWFICMDLILPKFSNVFGRIAKTS